MNAAVIVQHRNGNTRLPGKVLLPVLGRSLMSYQLERLKRSGYPVIVATTTSIADDVIADEAARAGVGVSRGSENDVLDRYIGAARAFNVDLVVRITGDMPLVDPEVSRVMVERYLVGDADHVDIWGLPDGMGGQVISRALLERIAEQPDITDEDREHVTLYVRRRPSIYRLRSIDTGLGLDREKWSLDTAEDYTFMERVIGTLYPVKPDFRMDDVLALLEEHPSWRNNGPQGKWDVALVLERPVNDWQPRLGDL